MVEFFNENWVLILLVAAVVAVLVVILVRPRQRVQLTDTAPVRPHMTTRKEAPPPGEGRGIADEFSAAASDLTGDILHAPVHSNLPGAAGPPDDLQRLKGVGPKFADLLNARGIRRFEQIARLTPHEVERLDTSLGAFRGRIHRDRIVEQADYLARGDIEGFEHRFGKL